MIILKKGTIKRIHVNRQNLARNIKGTTQCTLPVLSVQTSKGVVHGYQSVKINGPSKLIFPGKQLSCGARVWVETTAEVEVS